MVHVFTLGLVTAYVLVCGANLKLDYMKHGEIQLECVFKWGYAFDWYRNESLVIKTKGSIFNRARYEVLEDSLKNRTNLGDSRRVIRIQTKPEDYNSYWKCCGKLWLRWCSETVTIQKDNTVNKSVSSETEVETETINQIWTIESSPQVPMEGEKITLICTFDKPMDEELWVVFWSRDEEVLFVNNRSSSIRTNNFSDYFGDGTGSPFGSEENVKPDVAVSSDDKQQNITFSASTDLLNGHLWKCGNPFLEIGSNNLTISLDETTVTTACDSGTYGRDCSSSCKDRHCVDSAASCPPQNGACTCQPGWEGPDCTKVCSSGAFGQNCSFKCRFCLNGKACHHVNGSCSTFCDEGWTGDLCKTADPILKKTLKTAFVLAGTLGSVLLLLAAVGFRM